MKVFADLHLHSKYARATSKEMDIESLSKYGKLKGLNLIGTGDFTHPDQLRDIKEKLQPIEETGLYTYSGTNFMLTTEMATFYYQGKKFRRVHHVVHVPSLEIVDQIIDILTKKGANTGIDGRMMMKISSPELVETLIEISKDIEVVPAHLWTPFFGCLGSKTGFDSVKDCYLDQTKNIHALETGLSCYDPDTEILTEQGWKKFIEISKDDKICTLNKKTELIEYQYPQKIYSYNYKGKMYKVKTKRVDLLVTPNHRLAIRKYKGSPGFRKEPPIELVRADERFGVQKVFKKDGIWSGREAKYFVLPEVKVPHGSRYYSGNRVVKEKLLPIKYWLKFFGFWLAEGHTSPPNNGAYDVVVSNNDKNLLEKIKSVLKNMGFNPHLHKNKLRVRNYQLWMYLRQFGKAHEKWIPKDIKLLSTGLLRILFDYYIKGDGHVYGRNNKGLSATTSSLNLRDDLQEIALKIGMSAYCKHKAKPREQILPSGHENKHDVWDIYFIGRNEHRIYPAGVKKYDHWEEKWVDYEGKVYCVSVPNGIVYVRRNKIPVWCGNSDPPMNWRLSELDDFALMSNSDSHSPWPWRLGRECNVFDLKKMSYFEIWDAVRKKDKKRFLFTVEVDPAYGKYHWTGHRNCNINLSPKQALKLNNICPACRKQLTIGVEQRVEELADRQEGFIPKNSIPYKKLIPLSELIKTVFKINTLYSKTIWAEFDKLIKEFGNEFNVLLEAPKEELEKITKKQLVDLIIKNREGKIKIIPGYDGVYGQPMFNEQEFNKFEEQQKNIKISSQKTLSDFGKGL